MRKTGQTVLLNGNFINASVAFCLRIISGLNSALLAHLHTNLRATNTQIKHFII